MMTTIFTLTWIALQIIIGYNLVFPLLMYAMYSVTKKRAAVSTAVPEKNRDYAIIVTAYEQTDTLPAVVDSLLALDHKNFIVYIVADKCDVAGLQFDDGRVVVLRPPRTLASNVRSHFYAIRNFKRNHEVLTIIDSDNLVDAQYLNELDKCFDTGALAVQGVRKAKNLNSTYACLDAARDMYYHYYDGKLLCALGSSATLAGSGMAFTTNLYRECLEQLDVTGAGFDKVLQYEIVKRGHRIAFTESAIVYDEKTTSSDQLVKQRARWINTWFRYYKYGFSLAGSGLTTFDVNKLLFGVTLLRPPLFIFLLLSVFYLAANTLLSVTGTILWGLGFCSFIAGFLIAVFHSNPDKRVIRALTGIPKFIFYQLLALLRVKKANKISVATQHYTNITINDLKK